jgi:nicotinamide mononucleotide transporter
MEFPAGISPWEASGFITGLACVWMVVIGNIWNFPVGIISCTCFLILFWHQQLYGEAALQLVFIALGFHGWIHWASSKSTMGSRKGIGHVRKTEAVILAVGMVPQTGLLWYILTRLNGSAPLLDSVITALSLNAQWLLNRKRVENWVVWIAVDVLTISLGVWRGMYLLATLYIFYLAMCVAGWIRWRAEMNPGEAQNHA